MLTIDYSGADEHAATAIADTIEKYNTSPASGGACLFVPYGLILNG